MYPVYKQKNSAARAVTDYDWYFKPSNLGKIYFAQAKNFGSLKAKTKIKWSGCGGKSARRAEIFLGIKN